MATITESNELDVIAKYKELIKVSTDADSLYIKAKETLEQMYKDNDVPQDSKGEVLGQLISSLHTSVMSTSMNTALAWAAKEKEIALRNAEKINVLNLKLKTKITEDLALIRLAEEQEEARITEEAILINEQNIEREELNNELIKKDYDDKETARIIEKVSKIRNEIRKQKTTEKKKIIETLIQEEQKEKMGSLDVAPDSRERQDELQFLTQGDMANAPVNIQENKLAEAVKDYKKLIEKMS